jgi:hypothetical protein
MEKRKDTNLSESYITANCCGMALVSPTLRESCRRYDYQNVITILTSHETIAKLHAYAAGQTFSDFLVLKATYVVNGLLTLGRRVNTACQRTHCNVCRLLVNIWCAVQQRHWKEKCSLELDECEFTDSMCATHVLIVTITTCIIMALLSKTIS